MARSCLGEHAARRDDVVLVQAGGLRWIDSPASDAGARRGFCGECGSSLFWDPPGAPRHDHSAERERDYGSGQRRPATSS